MLKHTFRSSKILGEATKNVIHLMYLLKCNIFNHRSHNLFSATVRGLSHKVWSQTIQGFHHQLYMYTGNFKKELQLNYLLQNIQLQQGSHYLFKMRYTPARKVFSLKQEFSQEQQNKFFTYVIQIGQKPTKGKYNVAFV